MRLAALGWDDRWREAFAALAAADDVRPGRVAVEFNYLYRVYTQEGELEATLAGRVKHRAEHRLELPAVGDWVALRQRPDDNRGVIASVLPRRSWFSRKAAGNVTSEQVVAANIDVVFVVMALDGDFSLRRLERYLLLAHESGATPVVLLTKPDLSGDLETAGAGAVRTAGQVPVHIINPLRDEGLEHVTAHLSAGKTGALLGSSGVGKSTIINRLVGADIQRTREVREVDSKGRHTTTHRELVMLPQGGIIIDTPGMRELQLWDVGEAVRETFDDVDALAPLCRFSDCRHREEPGCAVKAAIAEQRLDPDRLASYLKLQDELRVLARQQDQRALIEDRRRSKMLSKGLRQRLKQKRGG